MALSSPWHTSRRNERLVCPSYTSDHWTRERLIFGTGTGAQVVEYADRLRQRDWNRARAARAACRAARRDNNTARDVELWLATYYQRPVKLRYVVASCDSSGYAVYCFGFDFVAPGTRAASDPLPLPEAENEKSGG